MDSPPTRLPIAPTANPLSWLTPITSITKTLITRPRSASGTTICSNVLVSVRIVTPAQPTAASSTAAGRTSRIDAKPASSNE